MMDEVWGHLWGHPTDGSEEFALNQQLTDHFRIPPSPPFPVSPDHPLKQFLALRIVGPTVHSLPSRRPAMDESAARRDRGRWQAWVGAFVLLGSLFTIGWTVVETWWG